MVGLEEQVTRAAPLRRCKAALAEVRVADSWQVGGAAWILLLSCPGSPRGLWGQLVHPDAAAGTPHGPGPGLKDKREGACWCWSGAALSRG